MNNNNEQPKSLIASFLEELAELTADPGTYAYRGQENAGWKVESAAYRRLQENSGEPIHEDFIRYHEKTLLEPARMNGYGIKEGRRLFDLELLAELQHQTTATCLIDFTYSFLVALWFACKGAKEKDGKVFILNTNDPQVFRSMEQEDLECKIRPILRFQTRGEEQQSEEATSRSQKPSYWHWSPHGLNRRILKQDGLFVFGPMQVADEHLLNITIAGQDKSKVLEELKKQGITRESLFKDLPGFAAAHAHNEPLPIEYESKSAENYFEAGNKASQRGNYKDAIANYDRAIERKPNHASAYNNRGITKANLRDYPAAIADYDRAIELNPDFTEAYNNRGNAKAELGKYLGAITDYDRAIELKPDYAVTYYNRGTTKVNLENYHDAIADFDRAIELKPDHTSAYYNRGSAKIKLEEYPAAIADFDQAIELKPDHAGVYNNRGSAKTKLEEYPAAIADFDQAIELNPDFAEAYNNRGSAKTKLEEYPAAIADFNRAIELKPNDAEAYNGRGLAEAKLGDYHVAIADFGRAIELNPDFANAHNHRGIAKAKLKDYRGAIASFDQAIELNPDFANAYNNRGIAKTKLGHIAEACSDFIRTKQLAEQSGDIELIKIIDAALSRLDGIDNHSK